MEQPTAKRVRVPASAVLDLALTVDAVVASNPVRRGGTRDFFDGDVIVAIDDNFISDRAELRGILISGHLDRIVEVTLHRHPVPPPPPPPPPPLDEGSLIGLLPTSPDHVPPQQAQRTPSPPPAPMGATASAANVDDELAAPAKEFRRRLGEKLRCPLVNPARCVILVCDPGLNPVEQIAILAMEEGRPHPQTVVCLATLRNRASSQDEATEKFKIAMRSGAWFVMSKADKSITLLSRIEQLVSEVREHQLAEVHPHARVILCTEPHPHFPTALVEGAASMRVHSSDNLASLQLSSLSRSNALRRCLDLGATTAATAAHTSKVRLNSFVSIVDIPTRDVQTSSASQQSAVQCSPGSQDALHLISAVQGFANEHFYTATSAGVTGQYAVGSSLGNVFVMDHEGAALISFHAHASAVWDISFRGELDLVTGGEDGHGVWWNRDPQQPDSLICTDVVRQPNDVYAVRHTSSGRAVGLGGYLPHVLIRGTPAAAGIAPASSEVLMPTAVQAMCNLEGSELLLCGGSDGTVTTIDAATATVVSQTARHAKKCPCISSTGPHTVVSGSYEGTVKIWDVRNDQPTSNAHVIKFKSAPVTGLSASGHYVAACVGESLHLWDIRRIGEEPLGTIMRAWKGSSRGIVIDAATEVIVTGSPDGFVRFWSFANA